MSRAIIELETGEVIKEISDSEIVRIYQRQDLQRYKINKKYFVKLYLDTLDIFSDETIHYAYFRVFFKLIKFMNFDNEFLVHNGLPLNLTNMSEICKINKSTLKKHIKKLEELEILKRIKNGRDVFVLINPYFIGYGRANTEIALKVFSRSRWAKR